MKWVKLTLLEAGTALEYIASLQTDSYDAEELVEMLQCAINNAEEEEIPSVK